MMFAPFVRSDVRFAAHAEGTSLCEAQHHARREHHSPTGEPSWEHFLTKCSPWSVFFTYKLLFLGFFSLLCRIACFYTLDDDAREAGKGNNIGNYHEVIEHVRQLPNEVVFEHGAEEYEYNGNN